MSFGDGIARTAQTSWVAKADRIGVAAVYASGTWAVVADFARSWSAYDQELVSICA